jgi:feruloyl esterase
MQSPRSAALLSLVAAAAIGALPAASARPGKAPPSAPVVVGVADCTAERLGSSIDASLIGEPVSAVTLTQIGWMPAAGANPAYCQVTGSMSPIDPAAPNINFRVALPSSWSYRYAQLGGGGMNGSIPGLTGGEGAGGSYLSRGWATAGSDSGHQFSQGNAWALNDESMKNLAYMQMKKTYDAAHVLMSRLYGTKPAYNYWIGSSQGGREGLTMAKRYPSAFDGIVANVPIVSFSSLMLAPEWIRIQEKPLANWVTQAKRTAIATEVIRQCDSLDGLADGIVNNYQACRAIFDVHQGVPGRAPWAAKRCPGGIDPNPADTSANACLTDGQIETLQFVHTRYHYATPLAFNTRTFGMWLPGTDPGGSGLIEARRYRGQEGAAADAPVHSHLGIAGVIGFLMQDLTVNPLDYVEGGIYNDRRVEISAYLDATHPDLTAFSKQGSKLIVRIGTNDTLASPGAQLDYYQSLLDRMGREAVDGFARLYVTPMTNHGLGGNNFAVNGNGDAIPTAPIPNSFDRVQAIVAWVENGIAPPKTALVTSSTKSLPLCSYPAYPRYLGGGAPTNVAGSYECATD